ncbi:high-affnity carbon uptake protein Hat/HatR [Pseudanabaena sp. lw0831]|uniref:serine/threonine-protein kinase n=1 Tax=Pseudanabaena sp. lw0831 TaxID=1357935 RepID=UPI0019150934|nr:serine/threonine-protein kinase [Pseudanabaena sp. lw0831]GBO52936.1 high-affnity carbon uptake protein Hat/HatR [Pseudanabaena sp. lw0831]
MSLCINPTCPIPNHPDNDNSPTCQGCGSELLIDGCYTVTKLLSDAGGFGVIYEATDRAGKPKILKILKQELNEDSKAVSLFQQEAFVLGQIEHAGIPKIETYVHHDLENGTMLHGIIMQKIEGLNLEQWINHRDRKPIAQKRAITWLRQLVDILAVVHRNKYFHRDIKPANIMLSPSGQLVLIDFGTAREATHTYLAKIGGVQGITSICSVGYTAPEQEKGFAVPQSDFYALGCTMIHLVTGKYPLDTYNPDRDVFEWRSHAPEISEEFADLIDALIARKPSDRPINCESILKILKEIELIDKLAPNDKTKAKRKSIKQSIKDSTRKPTSPILLTISVIIAAFVGLSIGTVIKISAIGNFEDIIQLPVFQKKFLNPTRFLQKHTDAVQNVALSPDGKIIASASDDGTVKLWELEGDNSNPIKEIKDQGGWVRAVVFLSDRQIVTAGQDKNIKIIDIASGKVVKTLSGHTNLINNLAIAPTSDLLVSGSYDNTVNLWQISTGKLMRSLTGHTDKIWGLAISPDGKQVVSASRDKTVRIWDVKTGENLKTLEHPSGVTCVLVTPDGKRVISGSSDKLIRVWDLASGKKLSELSEHKDTISAIAITYDSKYLFIGGKDIQNSIHLWNLQTKSSIWSLIGHTDLVTSLVITPDKLKLISGSQDKNINIWKIPEP